MNICKTDTVITKCTGSFHKKLNSEGASSEGSLSSMQQMDVIASDLECKLRYYVILK